MWDELKNYAIDSCVSKIIGAYPALRDKSMRDFSLCTNGASWYRVEFKGIALGEFHVRKEVPFDISLKNIRLKTTNQELEKQLKALETGMK